MCGLAGVLNLDGVPAVPEIARRMVTAIAHRGPDGEGVFVDGPLGLAHRRLAVIAPADGAQPMQDASGRFVLVYNGTVYNYPELRAELERAGCAFRGESDTEVVLAALMHWGNEAIRRFNGMFALALWDRRQRRLLLARDRYGCKPLYYSHCGQTLLFASEIKAILAHPSYRRGLDEAALVEYFTFQNFFTDRTLFAGVRTFPAGHWAQVAPGGRLEPTEFWDFHFREPETAHSRDEYVEELDRLFRQAVRRQLVADVPVGTYLSGGIDSGAVTAVAAGERPGLPSFTCGFDLSSASGLELAFDERPAAEAMSYRFGTEHYEMVLKAGDMERVLGAVVRQLEEPRVGQSYPNYYIARLASKFCKVVLSGTGGDELFAGYPWRYFRTVRSDRFEHFVDDYFSYWQRLIPEPLVSKVFAPIRSTAGSLSTRDVFGGVFRRRPLVLERSADYVNQSLYFEAKTFLHGLLVVEDKLSMAHGLESRTPFLDNELVDFAMSVPASVKLANLSRVVRQDENEAGSKIERYYSATGDGKLILRDTLARYVPDDIAKRRKQGFSAPDASWFKGESMAFVSRTLLDDGAAPVYQFLARAPLQRLIREHLDGRHNRRLLIWSLLNFNEWCRSFL